ncbi:hypothetical protein PENARI_c005G05804 [Penicillium arizonense]|uniref:Uncharacterized protein n=1 Tax=Penicillium arizonense TaxID=1835702 RepID=A0A1F5LNJ8_PENAI|nr:hypothetical protein PENARI_c005G05804 [Penicillium arizonense]OGE54788.1 hypothetical protein PENARI_c005G05804 [Penicillium arizonense]
MLASHFGWEDALEATQNWIKERHGFPGRLLRRARSGMRFPQPFLWTT